MSRYQLQRRTTCEIKRSKRLNSSSCYLCCKINLQLALVYEFYKSMLWFCLIFKVLQFYKITET
jgi:hypothetical protein